MMVSSEYGYARLKITAYWISPGSGKGIMNRRLAFIGFLLFNDLINKIQLDQTKSGCVLTMSQPVLEYAS
jgi:hypothetical protein